MSVLRLPGLPVSAGKQHWGNLPGAALSLAVAEAVDSARRFALLLTADSQNTERLEQELRFFTPDLPVLHFPDQETLPYDVFSPHQDIISQRIAALYQLPQLKHGVLVVPISTALHRLAPTRFLLGSSLVLDVDQKLDVERMCLRLEGADYRCVDTVYEHGEFAVHGALIDLFPMDSELPFRISLFNDEIETLHAFDPETQRSIDKVESIHLLPAHEFPLNEEVIIGFRGRFRERLDVGYRHCPIYQDLISGLIPSRIEYYLPLFFEETAALFDYLPQDTQMFSLPGIEQATEQFWNDVRSRYEDRRVDLKRPLLPPTGVFLPMEDCFTQLKDWLRVVAGQEDVEPGVGREHFPAPSLPNLAIEAKVAGPLTALRRSIEEFPGRVLFCAGSPGRREVLLELLARLKLHPEEVDGWPAFPASQARLVINIVPLDEGLLLNHPALALVAESPLFGQRVMQRRHQERVRDGSDAVIRNLAGLRKGTPVVHIDHGVSRYLGLITLGVDSQQVEFLMLQYAKDAKLYVPVANLHLIARYTDADDALALLHRFGSETWQKAKHKAAEQVRDVAAELLDIYTRRAAHEGFAFKDPQADYATFSVGFPFEKTPSQQSTIKAVVTDMLAPRPMDHLVCGNVGFDKTEMAMRAVFAAVHSGKQVAMLMPTTLLTQQHYDSFRDRFTDWPVSVGVMSRFKSTKEIESAARLLVEDKIDTLIRIRKLPQEDVKFASLGLIVIDEEHRFEVRQREQLKALRSEVDILTLIATLIPRTLNMTVPGMRDLSIVATPPAHRLSMRTFVMEQQNAVIKEALLRKLLRDGQVYYLCNEVKVIRKCARDPAELVLEARIGTGHGQVHERELERVMGDFYHKRFNVLVTSTIIETGIGVPSANIILVERADRFGLAQPYQLRGHVGRGHHQAYAYLLVPPHRQMIPGTGKRLEAIANAQDLGASFVLAAYDLEIHGAGELLDDGQSGQIQTVGFTLYMEMLERTVKAVRKDEQPDLEQPLGGGPEVSLQVPTLIPEDYLPDVHARLILCKRIANAPDEEGLCELQVKMIDRFGLLPGPAKNLIRLTLLELQAEKLRILKVDAGPQGGRIEFATGTRVDPLVLIKLTQGQPNRYKFEGATLLRFQVLMERPEKRFDTLEVLFERLTPQTT